MVFKFKLDFAVCEPGLSLFKARVTTQKIIVYFYIHKALMKVRKKVKGEFKKLKVPYTFLSDLPLGLGRGKIYYLPCREHV